MFVLCSLLLKIVENNFTDLIDPEGSIGSGADILVAHGKTLREPIKSKPEVSRKIDYTNLKKKTCFYGKCRSFLIFQSQSILKIA